MHQFTQCNAGVDRWIDTIHIVVIRRWDRLFQLFELGVKVHLRVFNRQCFPDQVENTAINLAFTKFGFLAERRIIGIHALTQTSHKGHVLPAFQLLKAQMNRVL
ncbi:hypothetical protein D3C78_1625120 [compost metagenome]